MKKNNDQLDELFRSKFENFEQEPPSYIWKRIRDQQAGKKQRAIFFYLKGVGVAAAILLAFLLGWQLQQSQEKNTLVLTEKTQVAGKPSPEPLEKADGAMENESTSQLVEEKTVAVSSDYKVLSEKAVGNEVNREPEHQNEMITHVAIEDVSKVEYETLEQENRKQEKESFDLLDMLGIELDVSFVEHAQLAEMKKKGQPKESSLSRDELSMIQKNAHLLAANRQNEESAGWQIGAMLAPGFAVSQSSQSREYANSMTYSSSGEDLNLGGGISVEYKTNKRWSLQSGVFYNKLGQTSSNQAYRSSELDYLSAPAVGNLTDGAEFFNTAVDVRSGELTLNTAAGVIALENLPTNAKLSSGFEFADAESRILLTETEFEQNFEYIEIPLIFRYQLVDATLKVQLLGGFNTSVLVGNEAYANNQDGRQRIGETRDMNSVNYSTSFGLGFGYGITDRISVRIEPQVKHFLGSLNSNSSVDYKPYTIGVYSGLTYKF